MIFDNTTKQFLRTAAALTLAYFAIGILLPSLQGGAIFILPMIFLISLINPARNWIAAERPDPDNTQMTSYAFSWAVGYAGFLALFMVIAALFRGSGQGANAYLIFFGLVIALTIAIGFFIGRVAFPLLLSGFRARK